MDHLRDTGELAARFAEEFGASDWARLAGLWHDLGKHRAAFQQYIRSASGCEPTAHIEGLNRVDHSTVGAIYALQRLGPRGRLLAYLIAGHHAGLPDWHSTESGRAALAVRLEQQDLLDDALRATIPADILEPGHPAAPSFANDESVHLWLRMLFSCVVDADFLDTERFMDGDRASQRSGWSSLVELRDRVDRHLATLGADRPIDRLRTAVREQCLGKAALDPGLFSLTVPTGGGKTLTSLRFALEHALHHGHQRVIYAIPYISIIEQTAKVFRDIVGDAVLEHHANLDPDEVDARSRVAAENWDAPLIVTTTVQLFESLFAARTSRCRKLHNLANSVLVLDEAQLLPPAFLKPILSVLRELTRGYGVSVVLCTATQPALTSRERFGGRFHGLETVRELVDDPEALWPVLERVRVEWPGDLDARTTWEDVAGRLLQERQVLCVVNSRRDCRELVGLLPEDTVHLSALMCPEHRSERLQFIKGRLKDDLPLRVVSTQLVEAGVDIDFPTVYRALAGLDSIAQSAGRCNREGRVERGRVVVFVPPKQAPPGHLRKGEQATRSLLETTARASVLSPAGFRRFFELLYGDSDLDEKAILPLLTSGARTAEIAFRTAAERFRMISDAGTATVLVPYRQGAPLLDELGRLGAERWLLRRLQRFTVTVHPYHLRLLQESGDVSEVQPGLFALISSRRYDERLGLLLDELPLTVEDLVA